MSKNKSKHLWSTALYQERRDNSMGKSHLNKRHVGELKVHMQKNEVRSLPHIIYTY